MSGGISITNAAIHLGEGSSRFEVLQDITLEIAPQEFVCILGPSGCGKSTLLGALAGHLALSSGSIRLDGASVTEPHPDRGIVGGFKRSSQQGLCGWIEGTRPEPRPVFSSPGSFAACC